MMIVLIDEKVKCGDDVIVIDVTTTSEFREYALNVQKNIYSLMTTISPRIEREYK
jgi:alanine racemase